MVSKNQLSEDLEKYLLFEEDAIYKLSNFYLAMNLENIFDPQTAQNVKTDLNTLLTESQKHASYIKEIKDYIEKSGKNEF